VTASRLKPPFMTTHPGGARVGTSRFAPKDALFAEIKSCNYLLNALMTKEAVDRGLDFVVSFDQGGRLAEGATENIGIVTADRRLLFPRVERILRGTTMLRVMELAAPLVAAGTLSAVAAEDIMRLAVSAAHEILIVGTTRNVVAVSEFDGRPVGDGKPGPVAKELGSLLQADMHDNPHMLTPVFDV
jgi:branched-chain amino acid aminotransferase